MLKKMKIRTKLLAAFLAVGVIPFAIIGGISVMNSASALSEQAFGKLEAMREVKKAQIINFFAECERSMDIPIETVVTLRQAALEKLHTVQEIKKAQVEEYFKKCLSDIRVISENVMIANALDRFEGVFDEDGRLNESMYNFLEEDIYGKSLMRFKEEYGYYDLLLITKHGHIVYTLNKESDLGQNLFSPLKKQCARQVLSKRSQGSDDPGF